MEANKIVPVDLSEARYARLSDFVEGRHAGGPYNVGRGKYEIANFNQNEYEVLVIAKSFGQTPVFVWIDASLPTVHLSKFAG